MAGDVIKSPMDMRDYRVFKLSNGLEVLLIHDPEVPSGSNKDKEEHGYRQMAAAALSVSVGSFYDPINSQGLAHLLEHMLYMGTSKFPEENEYDKFISQHGGYSNAETAEELTTYTFEIHHLHLRPALDRFSQLFVSPLIRQESIEREIKVVDIEFNNELRGDMRRLYQVRYSTADPLHPFNRFKVGNKKSFEECSDIREKLYAFYKQHYVAGRMKLVVLGGETLDTLQEWVCELFRDIPEGHSNTPSFTWSNAVWPFGKQYRIESVRDGNILYLSWPLHLGVDEYLKDPCHYILYLVNHRQAGSLLKFLKAEGLVLSLSAYKDGSTSCPYFSVQIMLTQMGLSEVHSIIGHVYAYINMLRTIKPQEWLFEELRHCLDVSFRFLEEKQPGEYVTELANNMSLYPTQHVIYADYGFEWDPTLVEDALECLQPQFMRVDILSTDFDRTAPDVQIEPWYGVQYRVEDIPHSLLDKWRDVKNQNIHFQLPAPEESSPQDFNIRRCSVTMSQPIIIEEDATLKAWYKFDEKFNIPATNFNVMITCRMHNFRDYVLSCLYERLVDDALNTSLLLETPDIFKV